MANNSKIKSGDVLKGAAAVTVAAGVVAAGVLLSDKKNRKKAGKMAAKGMKMAQEMAHEIGEQANDKYKAVQMAIPEKEIKSVKVKSSGKTKKTKTSS